MVRISICICTFRRPELLRRLLQAVFSQEGFADVLEVVVVDNDPAQSAAQVLTEFGHQYGSRLIALALQTPNISLARNAAIHAASADWISMVDDDECPGRDWLLNLFSAQQKYQADVVFAPVVPEYQNGVPGWIRRGAYFDRRRLLTGTQIRHQDARSGNVLVRKQTLSAIYAGSPDAGPFDPAYGQTGGEDSMLFRQLDLAGARMIWCDEAPVSEIVPAERATATWLLNRSFRTGQLYMRTELACTPLKQRRKRAVFLSIKAIVQAVAALLFSVLLMLFAPLKAFSWLRTCVSQLGKLNHFRGRLFAAYGDK
ncbi:glycosyltransferase [Undibacterium griseum]|uniref:Glycosyltransferase family 2 protein n=1 Tax=Undibacterium griseum TaxID=2762295 RepID=A0ABR6YQG9_9BURK|nr:glycosyltransferase family 2 protein [Undibacterium griseum]MBC3886156.1 glycosyltransferase family 2 protein [Undibacterium griseum]